MKKIAILTLLVNVACFISGQDIIYTISCEKDGENASLDSIVFENLSNDSRIAFGELPNHYNIVVNLSLQKLETNTGILNFIDKDEMFKVVKNIPGEISIMSQSGFSEDINLSIIDLKGQKLYSENIAASLRSNTINISIPNPGFYIVNLHSSLGSQSFKAIGSGRSGMFGVKSNINSPDPNFVSLKVASYISQSDFSFKKGDSLRITGYLDGKSTYPFTFTIDRSDSLKLFFIEPDENYFIVDNKKYPLSLGYNVWFSELDCGNFDIYAYGLYLTSGVTINKTVDGSSKSLLPSGKGNLMAFNMFNKFSTLVSGKYIFVDDIHCSGEVTDDDSTYIMGETDKFVTALKDNMNNPTYYAVNVDIDFDWHNIDRENPPINLIEFGNAMIGIKEGNITIETNNDTYLITLDLIDVNGLKVEGKYFGNLNFIEFGI